MTLNVNYPVNSTKLNDDFEDYDFTQKGPKLDFSINDSFCKSTDKFDYTGINNAKMICAMKMPSPGQIIKGMETLITISTLLNQLIDTIKDTTEKFPNKKDKTESKEYSEAA